MFLSSSCVRSSLLSLPKTHIYSSPARQKMSAVYKFEVHHHMWKEAKYSIMEHTQALAQL